MRWKEDRANLGDDMSTHQEKEEKRGLEKLLKACGRLR
jgi:hypothetical protein